MISQTTISKMPCKNCKMTGHNAKTCPTMVNVSSTAVDTEPAKNTKVPRVVKKTTEKQATEKLSLPDAYTSDFLCRRFRQFKESHDLLSEFNLATGLPIRHQNPPEDITENIAKFVIQNHDNDLSCKWAKSVGLNGDLCSSKYPIDFPPEVKAFTSDGPLSFGPDKKFGVIYFVNMIDIFTQGKLSVWKVNLTSESPIWKETKMNKEQTFEDQCKQGRRPRITWFSLYPQISEHCVKIYDGTFEGIFTPSAVASTSIENVVVATEAEQVQSTVPQ